MMAGMQCMVAAEYNRIFSFSLVLLREELYEMSKEHIEVKN